MTDALNEQLSACLDGALPTRTEIFPRCWLSRIIWCASGTPSKPSVRHSTGRIWPDWISSFAFMHS